MVGWINMGRWVGKRMDEGMGRYIDGWWTDE